MHILIMNCGSSSLKFQLVSMPSEDVLAQGMVDRIGQDTAQFKCKTFSTKIPAIDISAKDHTEAVGYVIEALTTGVAAVLPAGAKIDAFGHRVVHGGEDFFSSVIIDDNVIACIDGCSKLAPLHNPANLDGIYACQKALPGIPNIAVFDTAFHQTMEPKAFHYALPYESYTKDKIRRYGFHGTSHKFITEKYAEINNKSVDDVNLIICHLGNGSSITAVEKGKCVDTSMGFTPLQGLMMGTRCGDIDPAIVLYLIENLGMTAAEVNVMLNKESGVLGFSGISSDMRDVEEKWFEKDPRATLTVEVWAYSIAKYIGGYAAILPSVDAIIFTAGIGENAPEMREEIFVQAKGIDVKINNELNMQRGKSHCISCDDSQYPVWVIPTNEELKIALETYALLND